MENCVVISIETRTHKDLCSYVKCFFIYMICGSDSRHAFLLGAALYLSKNYAVGTVTEMEAILELPAIIFCNSGTYDIIHPK